MSDLRVAVLGGGNGAHAAVVEMVQRGFDVRWWRRHHAGFSPGGAVEFDGVLGDGRVEPATATGDLAAAVDGADLVLAPVPATAHEDLLARLAPVLTAGQVVVFTPGTAASWMGATCRPDVVFMETGTLPYLARCTRPGAVSIPVTASRLPTGSIPGVGPDAELAHQRFTLAFPSAVPLAHGLDAALTNWGPVIHPPLVALNLGAIESLGDRFDIHSEGTSASVKRVILALDDERTALRRALGLPGEHWPIRTHYERSPLGMYPPDAHDRLVASNLWRESLDLDHRYVHEDVLCGLVLNVSLGRLAGVAMPVGEAILALLAVALDVDPFSIGRTAESLHLDDLDAALARARGGTP
jgi:opine dehydrogenase